MYTLFIYVDHPYCVNMLTIPTYVSVDWGRTWEEPSLPGDVVAMVMVPHLLLMESSQAQQELPLKL